MSSDDPDTGMTTFELGHSISYKLACLPSEDSGLPAHPRNLISLRIAFQASAQVDVSLRRAHMQSCRKCCVQARFIHLLAQQAHNVEQHRFNVDSTSRR